MGDFYEVIKTIKGKPYRYRQRTFREGQRVRTESHYMGRASGADVQRIAADTARRRAGPTTVKVGAMFKALCDPALAATAWQPPWGGTHAGGAWQDVPALDRLAAAERIGVLVLGPGWNDPDPKLIAAYDRQIDGLWMPPRSHFPTQAAYYATLMHEVAHWTAHPSRLGRQLGRRGIDATPEERRAYAREEVVAEATSMLVLAELGYRPADIGNHALYLQTWLHRTGDPQGTLDYAMTAAQRAAGFILSTS